ncbi:MAG: hypothetical protein LBS08_01815 [Candidatus Symbiothrix sp.]|jgi:uncharacterized protein YxeA|nr:hypothetical protein [Candidatus Symbiothrix sp.]
MKKICIALFMVAALTVSLSSYAQDSKKEGKCCKAKTEQAEKESGEAKAGCTKKKDQACSESGDKKEKACCAEKNKKAKSAANKETAATETKSCGKKK